MHCRICRVAIPAVQNRPKGMNGAVVESVYTADLKSAGLRPCGFEPRPRYQKLEKINDYN